MKKIFIAMLVIMIVLVGCSSSNSEPKKVKENAEATTSNPEEGTTEDDHFAVVNVDLSKEKGSFKEVNAINNGPKSAYREENGQEIWMLDATEHYKTLQIPMVRLHDTEYPAGKDMFVDIHCIFPDFSADVDNPASYNFEKTDEYIANIKAAGAEVFYRLGESIVDFGDEDSDLIKPPSDYEKWTKICANIIRHYNEGWNNGYQYDIKYWEIWNEPDNKRQWSGSFDDYCELYRVAARTLKDEFPNIMIGGGDITQASEDLVQRFLDGIKADGKDTPLDFFSWHSYTGSPNSFVVGSQRVRNKLDENGYKDTLSVLGEWNYVKDWNDMDGTFADIASNKMASFYLASLIAMQKSPIDIALYYDGTLTWEVPWCGLYKSNGEVLPGIYGFQLFQQLTAIGKEAETSVDGRLDGVYYLASTGDSSDGIIITNTNENSVRFVMDIKTNAKYKTIKKIQIDSDHPNGVEITYDSINSGEILEMESGAISFITLEK